MYSPRVIAKTISAMESTFNVPLREYSPEDVHEYLDRMSDVWGDDGKPKRRYVEDEERFVMNELLMCSASFPYFAERYLTVIAKKGGIAPMYPLLSSQRFIIDRIAQIEEKIHSGEREDGILINLLKGARQIGGTTLAEAIICHRVALQNDVRALIASDKPEGEGTAYLYEMQERMLTHLPDFLRPTITDRQKGREIKTDGGSHILAGAGKSTRGTTGQRGQLGRGTTIHALHLSEVSTWDNAWQIDDALMPAVPVAPRTFVMLESTAKGRGSNSWWHQHWRICKTSRSSRFAGGNVFIPWYWETSYTMNPPVDWDPAPETLSMGKRIEEFGHLAAGGKSIKPTKGQLYWYETKRQEYAEKGLSKRALEEFLAFDDSECFQHSGEGIFSAELIQAISDRAKPMIGLFRILPKRFLEDSVTEQFREHERATRPIERALDEIAQESEEFP